MSYLTTSDTVDAKTNQGVPVESRSIFGSGPCSIEPRVLLGQHFTVGARSKDERTWPCQSSGWSPSRRTVVSGPTSVTSWELESNACGLTLGKHLKNDPSGP